MNKRDIPVYQSSNEYANCLEQAFSSGAAAGAGAASGATPPLRGKFGGIMGNTPLTSRHLGEISEDTVHVSVWAEYGADKLEFFQRLARAQYDARGRAEKIEPSDDSEYEGELDFDPDKVEFQDDEANEASGTSGRFIEAPGNDWFEFGGQLWRVRANGLGGRDGRSYYPYVICAGGVIIAFRREKHETVSNMWIEMGSIPLAERGGLEGVWGTLKQMFGKEGIILEKTIVSRVDIYADFDGVEVSEFCDRFNRDCRVTRARRIGTYREDMNIANYMMGARQTGFSIGTQIKLRVYDKRYELRNDPIKWGVFAERYDGLPDVLTRVEFQLRRVALKEFLVDGRDRIDGVESYLKAREQLWLYLTEDWFRLTEDDIDKKNRHHNRAKTWSVWERVQKAVVGVFKTIFRHARAPKIDMDALYRQALGCICKMGVYEIGEAIEREWDVLKHFIDKVRGRGRHEFWATMQRHYEDMHQRIGFAPIV